MVTDRSYIKVHIFDVTGREIGLTNAGQVFEVYKENGCLGIDWSGFTPLSAFATETGAVIFEEVQVNEENIAR